AYKRASVASGRLLPPLAATNPDEPETLKSVPAMFCHAADVATLNAETLSAGAEHEQEACIPCRFLQPGREAHDRLLQSSPDSFGSGSGRLDCSHASLRRQFRRSRVGHAG